MEKAIQEWCNLSASTRWPKKKREILFRKINTSLEQHSGRTFKKSDPVRPYLEDGIQSFNVLPHEFVVSKVSSFKMALDVCTRNYWCGIVDVYSTSKYKKSTEIWFEDGVNALKVCYNYFDLLFSHYDDIVRSDPWFFYNYLKKCTNYLDDVNYFRLQILYIYNLWWNTKNVSKAFVAFIQLFNFVWRKRDSNPWCNFTKHVDLANQCLKPLSHFS